MHCEQVWGCGVLLLPEGWGCPAWDSPLPEVSCCTFQSPRLPWRAASPRAGLRGCGPQSQRSSWRRGHAGPRPEDVDGRGDPGWTPQGEGWCEKSLRT